MGVLGRAPIDAGQRAARRIEELLLRPGLAAVTGPATDHAGDHVRSADSHDYVDAYA